MILINNREKGGKLKVSEIKNLLNASYEPKDIVDDFIHDKTLSSGTSQVYYNPKNNHAVVAHRGTYDGKDWLNNLIFGIGGKTLYALTPRYREAKRVQEEAEKKYGSGNTSTIGHSQAGLQAELLGKKSKEIITLNKATAPFSNYKNDNQFDISSSKDLVSSLNPFQGKSKNDIIIKNDTINPLSEHSIDILNRLNPDYEIGYGLKFLSHQRKKR